MQLVLKGESIYEELDESQQDELWRPEFASYMLEGTPGLPYGSTLRDCLKVEKSMIRRRQQVEAKLSADELLVSYSTFPRLGCYRFTGKSKICLNFFTIYVCCFFNFFVFINFF